MQRQASLAPGTGLSGTRLHEGPPNPTPARFRCDAEHTDVCFAGAERDVVLIDPGIELERGTAEDPIVAVDGHEHQRALRAFRHVCDSLEILRPCPLPRTDDPR